MCVSCAVGTVIVERVLIGDFSVSPFFDRASVQPGIQNGGKVGHIKLVNQSYLLLTVRVQAHVLASLRGA